MILACSEVIAVPRVATALVKPAACMAMTSMYPSQIIKVSSPEFFAKFSAKRFLFFRNAGVSAEFRYLGFESSSTRPPKATIFPDTSIMGNMTLPLKES